MSKLSKAAIIEWFTDQLKASYPVCIVNGNDLRKPWNYIAATKDGDKPALLFFEERPSLIDVTAPRFYHRLESMSYATLLEAFKAFTNIDNKVIPSCIFFHRDLQPKW